MLYIKYFCLHTVCPGLLKKSLDPFYVVGFQINWVMTFWTYIS